MMIIFMKNFVTMRSNEKRGIIENVFVNLHHKNADIIRNEIGVRHE